MRARRTRIAVGLSGGVDSSVAAALLKEKGYDVTGITMKVFDGSRALKVSEKHGCYGPGEEEDIEAAASVCRSLRIPFHVLDLTNVYRTHVIDYFRREYLHGRTPNPCVVCNRKVKFGFLLQEARKTGIDFDIFATGHYARTLESEGRWLLKKALDASKDQSYFLYTLTPDQLSRTWFPLGEHTKEATREMARSLGLVTAARPESQDFVAGGDYSTLFHADDIEEGDILDEAGNRLGKHRGIIHYTLGQRQGLGIASDRPLYVLRIDAERNAIVAGPKERLLAKGLIAADLNLIAMDELSEPIDVAAKIRLNHREVEATLFPQDGDRARIRFAVPQSAVTPGQSVVFYSGDTVVGGGVIEEATE